MDFRDAPDDGTPEMLTKEESAERLKTECNNLLSEIGVIFFPVNMVLRSLSFLSPERLEMSRSIQSKRLKNVMNLVNICLLWALRK